VFQYVRQSSVSRSIREIVHYSFQTIFENRNMKIHQETNFFMRKPQVRQELGFVNGKQFLNCLDFNNNLFLYGKVQSITAVELYFFVCMRQRFLFFNPKASLFELVNHARLIRGFRQSRTEMPMNLDGRAMMRREI